MAAIDAETYGCWGGGVGLGFGNAYEQFPGGVECFSRFLSSGNKLWEKGRQLGEGLAETAGKEFAHEFLEGERYEKGHEFVNQWLEDLPIMEMESRYVLFVPLSETDPAVQKPENVILTVDADQLSALVVLANYVRQGLENVFIPFAAGCRQIGIIPWNEALLRLCVRRLSRGQDLTTHPPPPHPRAKVRAGTVKQLGAGCRPST